MSGALLLSSFSKSVVGASEICKNSTIERLKERQDTHIFLYENLWLSCLLLYSRLRTAPGTNSEATRNLKCHNSNRCRLGSDRLGWRE